ncbi:protein ripply2 [Alosa alosa]|uniref:protein ripply2 n=1 Tax=Alosa alosa TaxID=278164 RepID=UPI00201512F4|nr:protein ripply2 [Alosa alosa]
MDHFTATSILSGYSEVRVPSAAQAPSLWRPWINERRRQPLDSEKPYVRPTAASPSGKLDKRLAHPVKLFWPRSRCFDYLYQDAEALLRNYPVQATICLYADSSSDEEDSDVEDEKA